MSLILGLPLTNIEHVGIVVNDLEKSMNAMTSTFGIDLWDVSIRDSQLLRDMRYYGRPVQFAFKVAKTRNKLGGVFIELLQSLGGANALNDHLAAHGESVHHLGSYRAGTMEEFLKISERMEKDSFPCVMSAFGPKGMFAYFDTRRVIGAMLEVNCSVSC